MRWTPLWYSCNALSYMLQCWSPCGPVQPCNAPPRHPSQSRRAAETTAGKETELSTTHSWKLCRFHLEYRISWVSAIFIEEVHVSEGRYNA